MTEIYFRRINSVHYKSENYRKMHVSNFFRPSRDQREPAKRLNDTLSLYLLPDSLTQKRQEPKNEKSEHNMLLEILGVASRIYSKQYGTLLPCFHLPFSPRVFKRPFPSICTYIDVCVCVCVIRSHD